MGNILNPADDNSFINLVEAKDTRVFVDKTDFIEKTNTLLKTDGKFLAVTRPRRFGKTVTAHTCFLLIIPKDILDRIFLTNLK